MESPPLCAAVPSILSSFVDAFVDFSVSGLFFPQQAPDFTPPRESNPHSAPTYIPTPPRLVAIGDLHGDLSKTLSALSLAGLADPATSSWTGGSTVAVQVGDVLDRGGDEIRILYLLRRLRHQAAAAGGALLTIHGNHEVMNVDGDFRFATAAGLREFAAWANWYRTGLAMKSLCTGLDPPHDPFKGVPKSFPGIKPEHWEGIRARIAALRPTGPISQRFLVDNQAVVVIGESVFVHGGLIKDHIDYGLEKINKEVREWILGLKGKISPKYMRSRDSLVWLRRFSEGRNCDCRDLANVLEMIPGTKRMIMGHTIQKQGINGVCEDKAIRIDVGLSKGCTDGLPEVLEIMGGGDVRVLTAYPLYRWRKQQLALWDEGLAKLVREGRRKKEMEAKA